MVVRGWCRSVGLVGVVGLVCVGLVGCGGSGGGLRAGVVAVFAGREVSLVMLEHWARVEGKIANEAQPGQVNRDWTEPDPPLYARCVARLEPAGQTASPGVLARYRGACEASYQEQRDKALNYLLRGMWEEQEATEAHIEPTAAEVEQAYEGFTRREYAEPGELQRVLAYTGMSVADEMLRVKRNMLEAKLFLRLGHEVQGAKGNPVAERALRVATAARLARLLEETDCRVGFAVEACRQARGVMRVKVE